ncbi:hypothetical protein BOTBODRAFT_471239 [Botryobasidium botryosum FD-172 SS1]|uniref:Uncharacterized protein n=1 Tax=Botryobasidium botryosum (strain FD-172 SS1) TaxID=930990 RepID=A0A067MH56_BOTB1|nr:hypothetical protein BOTBODRAFT_471239 [Botryobasidium botryosum FD-172 SS1]
MISYPSSSSRDSPAPGLYTPPPGVPSKRHDVCALPSNALPWEIPRDFARADRANARYAVSSSSGSSSSSYSHSYSYPYPPFAAAQAMIDLYSSNRRHVGSTSAIHSGSSIGAQNEQRGEGRGWEKAAPAPIPVRHSEVYYGKAPEQDTSSQTCCDPKYCARQQQAKDLEPLLCQDTAVAVAGPSHLQAQAEELRMTRSPDFMSHFLAEGGVSEEKPPRVYQACDRCKQKKAKVLMPPQIPPLSD